MEDTTATFQRLVMRIRSGDKNAFRQLVERTQRLVGHIVFRMVSNPSDREDLCQDVFLKVYNNLEQFRFQCKLSTWIAQIAYNTCVNHLKKKRIPLFDDRTPETMTWDDVPSDRILPDTEFEANESAIRIQNEINRLPPLYRAVVTLFHTEEMSYTEIARVMNLPEGTVKSHLFRARKQLKRELLKQYTREAL